MGFSGRHRYTCPSCEAGFTSPPIFVADVAYCCAGCADGGPCICSYEQDLADDGVDHLGLPFIMPELAEVEGERVVVLAERAR